MLGPDVVTTREWSPKSQRHRTTAAPVLDVAGALNVAVLWDGPLNVTDGVTLSSSSSQLSVRLVTSFWVSAPLTPSSPKPIDTLRCALDQMRHFLWFYSQVMDNDPELGDKLRQSANAKPTTDEKAKLETSFLDQLSRGDELVLLQHLAESKRRKPN